MLQKSKACISAGIAPVIRCTPARIGPEVQMVAAQRCIASGAALEVAYALVGTAQSRQIDQGPRRKR